MYLERWTIDELTETTVTLLRSRYGPQVDAQAAGDLPAVVMFAELTVTSEDWSLEVDSILHKEELARFIEDVIRRSSALGRLRDRRSLREGDVYWAVFAKRPPPPDRIGPDDTEAFLKTCASLDPVMGDVTAAARQAAKVIYDGALRPERST